MITKRLLIKAAFALAFFGTAISFTFLFQSAGALGKFSIEKDLYLAQFDCKTDTDDIHSVAAVKTMLSDPRFENVKYYAVAGAYGIQDGLYVPAENVFETAFGLNWSDAHNNYEVAMNEVSDLVKKTLTTGGDVWIADAGQSDFSADIVRKINNELPSFDTKKRIHIVQHSEWNEAQTAPDNLSYVKANTDYTKIPDGNVAGNGSPGFYSEEKVDWKKYVNDAELRVVWENAIETADQYNGKEERYKNPAIAAGGLDFSDVSETCYIFGFDHIKDAEEFFREFTSKN